MDENEKKDEGEHTRIISHGQDAQWERVMGWREGLLIQAEMLRVHPDPMALTYFFSGLVNALPVIAKACGRTKEEFLETMSRSWDLDEVNQVRHETGTSGEKKVKA